MCTLRVWNVLAEASIRLNHLCLIRYSAIINFLLVLPADQIFNTLINNSPFDNSVVEDVEYAMENHRNQWQNINKWDWVNVCLMEYRIDIVIRHSSLVLSPTPTHTHTQSHCESMSVLCWWSDRIKRTNFSILFHTKIFRYIVEWTTKRHNGSLPFVCHPLQKTNQPTEHSLFLQFWVCMCVLRGFQLSMWPIAFCKVSQQFCSSHMTYSAVAQSDYRPAEPAVNRHCTVHNQRFIIVSILLLAILAILCVAFDICGQFVTANLHRPFVVDIDPNATKMTTQTRNTNFYCSLKMENDFLMAIWKW